MHVFEFNVTSHKSICHSLRTPNIDIRLMFQKSGDIYHRGNSFGYIRREGIKLSTTLTTKGYSKEADKEREDAVFLFSKEGTPVPKYQCLGQYLTSTYIDE